MTDLKLSWWQKSVFYQIYPRSFADGNGDGIGDLKGIIDRLDYLKELGVQAIWLSPHYPSPQWDCGYDVADYTAVNPEYGTLDEFKQFLAEAHRRDLRVVLDLVLNHTSDQHPWFLESKSSRDNPKRDWYIWRDGQASAPPNNWHSTFGGPAWELDPFTGQYYYHMFFKQQPDLNWRNPQVVAAMMDAVRFWLRLGVDGFRVDAIDTLFEHPDFPNHASPIRHEDLFNMSKMARTAREQRKVAGHWEKMFVYQHDQPGMHEITRLLRKVVDEFPDKVLIGETEDLAYCGQGDELHMVFNFGLMNRPRLLNSFTRLNQRTRLAAMPPGGWPANTFNNHDTTRVLTRFGDGQHDPQIAGLAAALLLTLKGTPFLYNGEEIGMTDLILTEYDQLRDVVGMWIYKLEVEMAGLSPQEAMQSAGLASRDRCRTPMQWRNSANAGFSPPGAQPWLPVNPNYARGVNVADQENDPQSLLNTYRSLLRLRQQNPALVEGEYQEIKDGSREVLSFLRRSEAAGQTCLVVLNISSHNHTIHPDLPIQQAKRLFSLGGEKAATFTTDLIRLAPYEVLIAEL